MSIRPCLFLRSLACLLTGAISLTSLAAATQPTAAPTPEPRIITVTGQETVRIPATLARLSILIEARKPAAADATRAVREPSHRVLELLQTESAEQIQAGALTLNPVYRQKSSSASNANEPEISGYLAQWNASFVVPAERAGEFAAAVVDAGANRITQFEFLAADDAILTAQREALQDATRQARDTAAAVLESLGHDVQEVVRIHVNNSGPIRPFQQGRMQMMAMESSGGAATEPGFIDVDGNVTLDVRY